MNSSASSAALYNAWRSTGLSDNQARIMMAETGRENSWNLNTIFVGHPEPVDVKRGVANPRRNFGLISWNGDRRNNLINFLSSRGLWQNGRAVQSQATLDAMAQFAVREIATNPLYAPTKRAFLQNPNVDYSTATRELGNNYIKWRYNDPAYAEGHARRDGWYQKINNLVGAKPNLSNQRYPQQYRPQPTFQDPTTSMDSFSLAKYIRKTNPKMSDGELFVKMLNSNTMAGGELSYLMENGYDPNLIAKNLGLKKVRLGNGLSAKTPVQATPKSSTDNPLANWREWVAQPTKPQLTMPQSLNSPSASTDSQQTDNPLSNWREWMTAEPTADGGEPKVMQQAMPSAIPSAIPNSAPKPPIMPSLSAYITDQSQDSSISSAPMSEDEYQQQVKQFGLNA